MQVFKLSMKILKKNLPVMSIYLGIFIVLSILMMTSGGSGDPTAFQTTKTPVAFFEETPTPLTQGLREILGEYATFLPLEDDPEILKDALYYREIGYVLHVPTDFTQDFFDGKNVWLSKTMIPGSAANIYIDRAIDRYLNTARLYAIHLPDLNPDQLKIQVQEDLSRETELLFIAPQHEQAGGPALEQFFNYLSYTYMFVLILDVSVLLLSVNQVRIKQRNACAPLPAGKANGQLLLAVALFAFTVWVILVALSLIFAGVQGNAANAEFFLLNSFVFAATSTCISYLIANLVKGRESIMAIANIITLGSCFLSGVFVPQELLSKTVLQIARFLPTYWYVRGNGLIAGMMESSLSTIKDLVLALLIQGGFAAFFLVLSLIVGKKKRLSWEKD